MFQNLPFRLQFFQTFSMLLDVGLFNQFFRFFRNFRFESDIILVPVKLGPFLFCWTLLFWPPMDILWLLMFLFFQSLFVYLLLVLELFLKRASGIDKAFLYVFLSYVSRHSIIYKTWIIDLIINNI